MQYCLKLLSLYLSLSNTAILSLGFFPRTLNKYIKYCLTRNDNTLWTPLFTLSKLVAHVSCIYQTDTDSADKYGTSFAMNNKGLQRCFVITEFTEFVFCTSDCLLRISKSADETVLSYNWVFPILNLKLN